MPINEALPKLIQKRAAIAQDVDTRTNPLILEMIDVISNNIDETIVFLDTDCTGEQLVWLSEIFDELVEKTQSKSLIDAFRRCANRHPSETSKYNIIYFIDTAEDYLE